MATKRTSGQHKAKLPDYDYNLLDEVATRALRETGSTAIPE